MLAEALLELAGFALCIVILPAGLLFAWWLAIGALARGDIDSARAFMIPRATRARARTLKIQNQTLLQLISHESAVVVNHGDNRIAKR
jgi:hypothetical protein